VKAASQSPAAAAFGLLLIVAGVVAGLAASYWHSGERPNWYAVRDVEKLPASPQGDLIVYGYQLVTDTQRYLGPDASDAALRFAGNNLACGNCHLRAGLQPFAAPFVSTYTSFPMMVDDRVITLTERINGCMTRSMNGRPLPADGGENAGVSRIHQVLGTGNPNPCPDCRNGLAAAVRTQSAARSRSWSACLCRAVRKMPWRGRTGPPAQRPAAGRI
jgi:thiosulfate dehydrogenase